jgi:hypothetical protein
VRCPCARRATLLQWRDVLGALHDDGLYAPGSDGRYAREIYISFQYPAIKSVVVNRCLRSSTCSSSLESYAAHHCQSSIFSALARYLSWYLPHFSSVPSYGSVTFCTFAIASDICFTFPPSPHISYLLPSVSIAFRRPDEIGVRLGRASELCFPHLTMAVGFIATARSCLGTPGPGKYLSVQANSRITSRYCTMLILYIAILYEKSEGSRCPYVLRF